MNDAADKYSDIIDMPHHVSANHPRMSLYERAAQFAPFAALGALEDEGEEKEKGQSCDCPLVGAEGVEPPTLCL